MRITILGTGTMAEALGCRWVRAGHEVTVAGRAPDRAAELAVRLGAGAQAPGDAVARAEAVLLAVPFGAVAAALTAAGATDGAMAGVTLVDPTNALEHGTGVHTLPPGVSAIQRIAALAPGAQVVKAFHLFPAGQWTDSASSGVTVPICGDHPDALATAAALVRDLGAIPAVFGGLDHARQLEEAAGFAIRLAFAGVDPRTALSGPVRG